MPYCHACDKNVDTTGDEGCERPGCPVFAAIRDAEEVIEKYASQIHEAVKSAVPDRDCLEAALHSRKEK